MVVLKKIKAATLIEALAAVLIIVTIFMIASTAMQNVFLSNINNDTRGLDNRLKEIHYLLEHNKIELPFGEQTKDWEIYIDSQDGLLQYEILHIPSNTTKSFALEN